MVVGIETLLPAPIRIIQLQHLAHICVFYSVSVGSGVIDEVLRDIFYSSV